MTDVKALTGLRILIVGLGKEGVALAGYLARHGLTFTANDRRTAAELGDEADRLAQAGVSLVLGEHPTSLLDEADLLFVSPGVPLEVPLVQEARARNIPLSTESRLFCHLCPAPIIAITGSSGKTTTTTLLGKIMVEDGRKTWVGGNIGRPLIGVVDDIQPDDTVIMELSSFQLEYFHARLNKGVDARSLPAADPEQLAQLLNNYSPATSAILNITPNHLDRHPSMKQYVRAKRAIIEYQQPGHTIIMSLDNDMTRTIGHQYLSRVRWFSLEARLPNGAGLVDDQLVLFDENLHPQPIAQRSEIQLRGIHNLSNVLAACLLADTAGASREAMHRVVTSFAGVEHRLQFVRTHNEVAYYDDSIATTPERVIAALHAFTEPLVLLVGGRDKRLPWDDAARLMLHKVGTVIVFGEATEVILEAIEQVRLEFTRTDTVIYQQANMAEALQQAVQVAQPGSVVLLSPGCASYDEFSNFSERGYRFQELVQQL